MDTNILSKLPKNYLLQLITIVETQYPDSYISMYDETFVQKSLVKRIHETGCESYEAYEKLISVNTPELTCFIESLHNSYSEFFRNPLTFSVMEQIILPSLIHTKKSDKPKEIRIWSAACAAGQEAYSLAMLLEEMKNGDTLKFSYRLFATDQSEVQVKKSQKGQYAAEELNNVSLKRVKQWFGKQGQSYSINQELKQSIDFSVFDLFSRQHSSPPASIFGDFDLLFCANLLFYYKKEYREVILKKIDHCLAKGGFLITGETEREILISYGYREVISQSAIFQKKAPG